MAYPVHPACAAWPPMPDSALSDLADDIHLNGLRNPIVLTRDGLLLDGRNREAACEAAGVVPTTTIYEGDDPVGFTVSMNQHRRHMTAAMIAAVGGELMDLSNGQHAGNGRGPSCSSGLQLQTSDHIAARLGVHPVSVRTARRILNEAPVLHGMVRDGSLPLADATQALRAGVIAPATAAEARTAARNLRSQRGYNAPIPRTPPPRPRHRPAPAPAPVPPLAVLTPAQIDPEFTGTVDEFMEHHGHVRLHTAAQQATSAFTALADRVRVVARADREHVQQMAGSRNRIDFRTPYWLNWLREVSARDVRRMTEARDSLRDLIEEVDVALARATEVSPPDLNTSRDLSGSEPEQGRVGDSEVRA
jgi:hypothetical protein